MLIIGVVSSISLVCNIGKLGESMLPSTIADLVANIVFALTGILGFAFLKNKEKYNICKIVNWLSILTAVVACVFGCLIIPSSAIPAELVKYKDIAKVLMYVITICMTAFKLIFNFLYFKGIKKNQNM